jgi:hypothetical protein
MSHLLKIVLTSLLILLAYGATAQTWTITVQARTEPTSSSGSNYSIIKTMTVATGACGGNSYLVGIPDTGTSDFTSTEADHIANWLQVYQGLSEAFVK